MIASSNTLFIPFSYLLRILWGATVAQRTISAHLDFAFVYPYYVQDKHLFKETLVALAKYPCLWRRACCSAVATYPASFTIRVSWGTVSQDSNTPQTESIRAVKSDD